MHYCLALREDLPMAFHARTRQGEVIADPDISVIRKILDELGEPLDPEHPDVALSHESGWTLSAFPGGLVIWENVETDEGPQHRSDIDRDQILRLWLALAEGGISKVDEFGWSPGYGPQWGSRF